MTNIPPRKYNIIGVIPWLILCEIAVLILLWHLIYWLMDLLK